MDSRFSDTYGMQKLSLNCIMSLNLMILYIKLKNGLFKIVTKSQVVTRFNVTKSRLHCICNSPLIHRFLVVPVPLHYRQGTCENFRQKKSIRKLFSHRNCTNGKYSCKYTILCLCYLISPS